MKSSDRKIEQNESTKGGIERKKKIAKSTSTTPKPAKVRLQDDVTDTKKKKNNNKKARHLIPSKTRGCHRRRRFGGRVFWGWFGDKNKEQKISKLYRPGGKIVFPRCIKKESRCRLNRWLIYDRGFFE